MAVAKSKKVAKPVGNLTIADMKNQIGKMFGKIIVVTDRHLIDRVAMSQEYENALDEFEKKSDVVITLLENLDNAESYDEACNDANLVDGNCKDLAEKFKVVMDAYLDKVMALITTSFDPQSKSPISNDYEEEEELDVNGSY